MWSNKKDKTWMHYIHDIIAADVASGVFLAHFLRQLRLSRNYVYSLEIVDLQRYKMISKPSKVKVSIRSANEDSFVFVVGKN